MPLYPDIFRKEGSVYLDSIQSSPGLLCTISKMYFIPVISSALPFFDDCEQAIQKNAIITSRAILIIFASSFLIYFPFPIAPITLNVLMSGQASALSIFRRTPSAAGNSISAAEALPSRTIRL